MTLRGLLKTMVDDVEAGRDPLGVSMVDGPPRRVEAGAFSESAATAHTTAEAVPTAGA